MQSVTTRKARVIHWTGEAHDLPIFQVFEAKRDHMSIKIILKNLVGNANPIICLCYELGLFNVSTDIFLGSHMCKNIIDTL